MAALAPIFGLGSAASWGSGDFVGGLASRRAGVPRVAATAQLAGLALLAVLAHLVREPLPSPAALLWAAGAGLAGGSALIALWRALAVAPMGIGAPVAAVVSGALPVAAGVAGEGIPSPATGAGFILALVGLWLVARSPDARSREGLTLALGAGAGFGLYYVLIDRALGPGVLWPLVAGRVTSSAVVAAIAARAGQLRPPAGSAGALTALAGALDVGGNACFALAAAGGRLDVAGVLASLYPAMTVLLARTVLKERLAPRQAVGAVAILAAVPLIV